MRIQQVSLACILWLLCAGCATKVGTEKDSSAMRVQGLVNGYVSVDALKPYDGNILTLGVLGQETRHGELVSLDLWPVLGVGVGVVGVRARVLFLESGVGLFFYDPQPPPRQAKTKESTEPEEVKEKESETSP